MPDDDPRTRGVLADIRVVEIAQVMAIPMCGLLLADMGADVIKIEPPAGDSFRHSQSTVIPGESKGFTVYNRGKRSVCLDLTSPDGKAAADRLIAAADIVLVSMKPSDVPRYGLTYEQCVALNPAIIYLDHIPMGERGPFAQDGGYDVVVQGISGLGAITDRSPGDAPVNVRPAYTDAATGILSALGVVAALRHRDATGEGQRVVTSLLQTGLVIGANVTNWFAATDPPVWDEFRQQLEALRSEGAGYAQQRALYDRTVLGGSYGNIYFRHYRTADGFISVGSLSPTVNARFRKVTGITDPRTEPDFVPGTVEAWDALTDLIRRAEDCFRTRTTAEWIEALHAGGVPCGPFNFPTEVFEDPQILENDFVVELEHPLLGAYKTFAPPIRMEKTPTSVHRHAPVLGEHTEEVLAEAGFEPGSIERLLASGVAGARLPGGTGY
jgi:crotonobetainyl-CoA:carnitine CoA-transferase CaiB-like acyl-CoA transferase